MSETQARQRSRRIPLPKHAYPLSSPPESAEDLLNLFAEAQPAASRDAFILRPTPGTVAFGTPLPTGPIYAMEALQDYLYVVAGGRAYRRHSDFVEDLGAIPGGNVATIAIGPTHVVFCAPPQAYIARHDETAVTQITGDAFPGASSVCYLNGRFIFTQPNSAEFFVSKLTSGAAFDPLDYATTEAMPGVLCRVVTHAGALWLFNSDVVEVWADQGAADFPFRRVSGGAIYKGCIAPTSIARLDNELVFLGRDNIVYQTRGLQVSRISNSALEQSMFPYRALPATQESTIGCSYTQEGHQFYSLSFINANNGLGQTWVYDAMTQLWHRRSDASTGGRWRANCAAAFGENVVVGDGRSAQLSFLQPDSGTDNGQPIPRIAVFPPLTNEARRVFMHRLEIEMETGAPGVASSVVVDWSDDGGATYGPSRTLDTSGALGRRTRVFTTLLGSFQESRTLRIRAVGRLVLYAADADMTPGAT